MNTIQNALLSPAVERMAEQKIAQVKAESQVITKAAAAPLPGPTRDIFKIDPDIKVGKWSVRPFYDIDFVFLEEIGHPLAKVIKGAIVGQEMDDYIPSGSSAWNLFWIMTHGPSDVEASLRTSEGREEMFVWARREFACQPLRVLIQLYKAVVRQIEICTSAEVEYVPSGEEGVSDPKS